MRKRREAIDALQRAEMSQKRIWKTIYGVSKWLVNLLTHAVWIILLLMCLKIVEWEQGQMVMRVTLIIFIPAFMMNVYSGIKRKKF